MVAARLLLLAVCFTAGPLFAADASPKDREEAQKKAVELVRKLGNPVFRVREEAARDLMSMGSLSLTALKASVNDPDVEIRERCRRLLPIAEQADLRIKLAAFVADKDGKKGYDLPGWKRFAKVVGDDAKCREFYADMLKTHFDLFEHMEADPTKTASAYFVRCSEIYNSMYGNNRIMMINGAENKPYQVTLKEFSALLFISADGKVDSAISTSGKSTYNTSVSQMMYQNYFRSFLSEDKEKDTFRKIFLDWLDVQAGPQPKGEKQDGLAVARVNNSHQQNISAAMNAIQNSDIKEAAGFIERLVNNKDVMVHTRAQAVTTLGRIGTKEHIKMLEPLLKEETVVGTINFGGNNAGPVTSQMRDVALGIIIHLEGKKPSEFDFDGMKQYGNINNGQYYYYMFGFSSDENRMASYKKWNDHKDSKVKMPLKESKAEVSKEPAKPTPKVNVPKETAPKVEDKKEEKKEDKKDEKKEEKKESAPPKAEKK